MSNTVMICGLGSLGELVLEFLARTPSISEIVALDINGERGLQKVRGIKAGALLQGYHSQIRFIELDLHNEEEMRQELREVCPSVIVHTASLSPWLDLSKVHVELREKIERTAPAVRLPLLLTLTYKLMKAVRSSDISTSVVNASLPDIVNPMLAKINLAPTIGFGNIELIIPGLKNVISEAFRVPTNSVSVFLVAHTFHSAMFREYTPVSRLPFFLKVLVDDVDITRKIDVTKVLAEASEYIPVGYVDRLSMVASSAVKNVVAILNDTRELTHSPGPVGLPGSYPVRLGCKRVEIVLPEGLSLEQAVEINTVAQRAGGVERIEDDGAVVFTSNATETMKDSFGFGWERMSIDECGAKAQELLSYHRRFMESR